MPENLLTAEERAAIRARADAATEGPWTWGFPDGMAMHAARGANIWAGIGMLVARVVGWAGFGPKNAEFIAHARADVPRLLDDLEALHAKVAELERTLNLAIDVSIAIARYPGGPHA